MATENPTKLPLKYSVNKHALAGVKKNYASGNNISKTRVARFYSTGDGEVHGDRTLPKSLDTAQAVVAVAVCSMAAAGAGGEKVRVELAYNTADSAAAEDADPASWQQTVTQSVDVSGWTAKKKRRVTFTLTAANLAALDHLEYYLKRIATHADDNVSQALEVHDLFLLASY